MTAEVRGLKARDDMRLCFAPTKHLWSIQPKTAVENFLLANSHKKAPLRG